MPVSVRLTIGGPLQSRLRAIGEGVAAVLGAAQPAGAAQLVERPDDLAAVVAAERRYDVAEEQRSGGERLDDAGRAARAGRRARRFRHRQVEPVAAAERQGEVEARLGAGAPAVERGIERDGLAKYLIPSDADPDDLYSTALPMDELQTIFGRIEAERVVVFLDACYSGAAGGRSFTSKKTRAVNVDDLFLERLTRSKGRAIITASRPAEVSIEMPELGHGLFTYYLLQGLQGAADLNRDGIVSLQELYEYVEQQVSQRSRSMGGNQHPVMKGELEVVLPLVKVKAP